ncbi:MAG: helix-turn-helix transcriptional regulator [Mogibacterium sp.]|nr:helix-turn-helix transcriptional regulator [Mogibacterium sp.]
MTMKEHVGARINLYRKKQNLTLEQLALLIGKSTSTISKYELGKISIDIDTLYQIAKVLQVSVSQLTDYREIRPYSGSEKQIGFFSQNPIIYMYQYFSPMKEIVRCVIEMGAKDPAGDDQLMLYYDVRSMKDYKDASFIYHGTLHYTGPFAVLRSRNIIGMQDELFLYIKIPLWNLNVTTGLMMCQSQTLGNPVAAKIVLSKEEITDEAALRSNLILGTKDVLTSLKQTNYLQLIDTWETRLL